MQILLWIWRGKSITRAMLNVYLSSYVKLEGTVIDLGGGGRPSYLDVLTIDNLFNMDRLEETRPSFLGNLERTAIHGNIGFRYRIFTIPITITCGMFEFLLGRNRDF